MSDNVQCIHVEGMDLAGKTSVCRGLMQALRGGWRLRHNSLCVKNPVHELADRMRKEGRLNEASVGLLYVAALDADLQIYEPPSEDTIQDSTILLRSLAYHTVAETPHIVEALSAMLPRHPKFTFSFVLTANRDERLKRLEQRRQKLPQDVSPDDLLVVNAPDRFFAMEEVLIALARQHFNAEVIDTSSMATAAVVDEIIGRLVSGAGISNSDPALHYFDRRCLRHAQPPD